MAAEAHGLTESAGALEWIRALYFEMRKPSQPIMELVHDAAELIPVKWFDDANSLVSHLLADAGQIADRRVRVVIAALRELLSHDGVDLEWCDTSVQLADALTKLGAERTYLTNAMKTGYVTLRVSDEAAATKEAIRSARRRRADERRSLANKQAVSSSGL